MSSIDAAAALLAVLGHPARFRVVALLLDAEPRPVGDFVDATGLERTAMSHQLRVLREARLVTATRSGRQQLYRLADHHVAHIVRDALAHVEET